MGLKKLILTILLRILNIFRFCMPLNKHKVTFISLTSNKLEQDFKEVDTLLQKEGCYDIHYNLTVFKQTLWGSFCYMLNCMRQLYEIHTSAIIILNDNNFVVTKFKKPGTIVIQMWHACGAVKKFGNQIVREYPICNYDYVIANSEVWKPVYHEAFGVSEDQVIVTGMPRVDHLSDPISVANYRSAFFQKYPQLHKKRIVLYAPTFRGNIIKGLRYDELDLPHILQEVEEDIVILYKMHPLLKDVQLPKHPRLVNVNEEDLYMLMCASDCLVTDYSSIIFDYSLLAKRVICYASDFEEYDQTIGFNIPYRQEMPEEICVNELELIQALQRMDQVDTSRLQSFQQKYMPYTDGQNATRICEFIKKIEKA